MLKNYIVNESRKEIIERGDLFYADLRGIGNEKYTTSIQEDYRPVVVIQNDTGNKYSPNVIVVPLTSKEKKYMPTHVSISGCGLRKDSTVLCEQILTIPKNFLGCHIGKLSASLIHKVNEALRQSITI